MPNNLARRTFLATAASTPLMAANDRISTAFIGVGVMGFGVGHAAGPQHVVERDQATGAQ